MKKISKTFNVKNAIVCNSGTAALHLIYSALGLKGDIVLTSPLTFIATANAALMCGAKLYLLMLKPCTTGMLTPESIDKKLKVKSIMLK